MERMSCRVARMRTVLEIRAAARKASAKSSEKKGCGGRNALPKRAGPAAGGDGIVPAVPAEVAPPRKKVRDGQHYIKTEVLKKLGDITDSMIKKAEDGEASSLKLLWQLGKMHEDSTAKRKKRPLSLGETLLRELLKKDAERKLSQEAGSQK